MVLRKLIIIPILSLILMPVTPAMADSATVSDISKQLVCQCGCTLILSNCDHIECSVGVPMKALIEQKLDQGQSEEAIIQFFVAQYGEQVLASPPKKGFNLVAWLLPFAGLLAGIGVVYIIIKKWVRQGKHFQASPVTENTENDEEYQKQLEKELKDFTEGGFR